MCVCMGGGGVLTVYQFPRFPFPFSPNFGRFPGEQPLNTATVSLLADAWIPSPGGWAGLDLSFGKAKWSVLVNGLRTGHNRAGCSIHPLPHPSSPLLLTLLLHGNPGIEVDQAAFCIVVARTKFISTHQAISAGLLNPLTPTNSS